MTGLVWVAELICLAQSTPPAVALDDVYAAEREVLVQERAALQAKLAGARSSAERARQAVESELDRLGADVVKLRIENIEAEAKLPEQVVGPEDPGVTLNEVQDRGREWLARRGHTIEAGEDVLLALFDRLAATSTIRRERAEVFDAEGRLEQLEVLSIGRVAAIAGTSPLLPTADGYLRLDLEARRRDLAQGVIQTAVVFDPEEPHDPAFYARASWATWWQAGGVLQWAIALALLGGLFVVVERVIRLGTLTITWRRLARKIATHEEQHRWDELSEAISGSSSGTLSAPLVHAIDLRNDDVASRHERITDALLGIRPVLFRGIGVLGIISAVAPLLGLLGTVTGMIATFTSITKAGVGDPELLSDGISQALVTTQFGLSVAIPALLLAAALRGWATIVFNEIEERTLTLCHHVEDAALHITEEPSELAVSIHG